MIAHVVVPLVLGVAIYAAGQTIPSVVAYYVPDFLWMYAFTATVARLWWERSLPRCLWLIVSLLCAVGCEFAQLMKLVPGTFDWLDLGAFAAAWSLALIINRGATT